MSILADILGIRLFLRMGATIPIPVSYEVIAALNEATVTNDAESGDAFRLTFSVAKSQARDFSLLGRNALAPDTRVAIAVAIGAVPEPLVDGVIERHELDPNEAGGATLTVFGKGLEALLDRATESRPMPQQSASSAVRTLLGNHTRFIQQQDVRTPAHDPTFTEQERVAQQRHVTDLAYIRELARRVGFVFVVEPATLATNRAYWGPRYGLGPAQPMLTYNMGGASNLKSLRFSHDALAPVRVSGGSTLDVNAMSVVNVPGTPRVPSGMAAGSAQALRTERLRCAARFDAGQLNAMASAIQNNAADPITGAGEVDALRYGKVLRANRSVEIRGTGFRHNGRYQVSSVTHTLRRGEYSQSFRVFRDGEGSTR